MYTHDARTKVITIGVGGATSSGKTTLVKHLQGCLHNSLIIHQDDFVTPLEKLPVDTEYGFADCEDAPTAVDWDRMATFLSESRMKGILPADHRSFEGLNEAKVVPVDQEVIAKWQGRSEELVSEHLERYGEKLVWVLIDGFLLYWDERIVSNLDVRVFLRVPEDIARARREDRTYHTPDGGVWRDPPHYWEKAIWPAYTRAHKHIFEGGDVIEGIPNETIKNIMLFEPTETRVEDMVDVIVENVINVSAKTFEKN